MLEGTCEIRRGSLPDALRAARAEITVWNAEAAGIVDLMKCGLRGSPTVVKQVFAPKPRELKAEQVPTGDKSYADLSEVVMERILGLQPTLEADLLRMAAAY
jgi:electron transfer flavoprotein beta subunit